jgi:uncharacterized protein (TIGR03435 family)
LAQQPTAFEVASIRPTQAAIGADTSFTFDGGTLRIVNEPASLFIREAFRLQNAQITNGPDWLATDRYNIEAKTGRLERMKLEQIRPMIQSLLVERFRLKFHYETREMNVLALVVAKNGRKLKLNTGGKDSDMNASQETRETRLVATDTPIDLLAAYVGNRLHRMVTDQTGLTGTYDFMLTWAPDDVSDSPAPTLRTALREQLGLTLQPQKEAQKLSPVHD